MGTTLDEMRGADTIDTRDIIERIAEIEGLLKDVDESDPDLAAEAEDLRVELDGLQAIVTEYDGRYFGDSFADGVTLVADSYFEDYARELAVDLGAIERDEGWPASFIDWDAAANALKTDYSAVEIDGTTYWGRA